MAQTFTLDFPGDLPSVKADSVRMERILYNLLDNAAKYSPRESEIRVCCRAEEDFVITEVIDQGKGISPDDQGKLFELFQRLETPSPAEGVGIGLVVCWRLAESHKGWITVDSEPGKGSVFTLALPLHRGPA